MGVLKMQQAEAVGVLANADTSKAEVSSQQRIPIATKTDLNWQRCQSLAKSLEQVFIPGESI